MHVYFFCFLTRTLLPREGANKRFHFSRVESLTFAIHACTCMNYMNEKSRLKSSTNSKQKITVIFLFAFLATLPISLLGFSNRAFWVDSAFHIETYMHFMKDTNNLKLSTGEKLKFF